MRRRSFVVVAAGVTACSRKSSPWKFLTEAEGATLNALCDQIIPPDNAPGAGQAGAVSFIDRQLCGFHKSARALYRKGLAEIDARSRTAHGKAFHELEPQIQLGLLKKIEKDPATRDFFNAVVAHTMQSYYGPPRHGGNRDAVSWRMLGLPYPPVRGRLVVKS